MLLTVTTRGNSQQFTEDLREQQITVYSYVWVVLTVFEGVDDCSPEEVKRNFEHSSKDRDK